MANLFSDNFADATGDDYSASRKTPGEIGHARLRKKRMNLTTGATTSVSDTMVLGKFKSGDRLYDLQMSTNSATATTGAINIGLYVAALNHVPVTANIVDVDLFGALVVTTTVLERSDVLVEAGTILGFSRGLTLWEMAALGAGSDTVDPMVDYDLVATFSTALDAAQGYNFEADYVSFG